MASQVINVSVTLLLLSLFLIVTLRDINIGEAAVHHKQSTNISSPWLARLQKHKRRNKGCSRRPWICNSDPDDTGLFPPRLCCRNQCVDVHSDPYNCGFCGIHCQFTRDCCQGICVDVMTNPFHCGSCFTRCPSTFLCIYGICGYADPRPISPSSTSQAAPRRSPTAPSTSNLD